MRSAGSSIKDGSGTTSRFSAQSRSAKLCLSTSKRSAGNWSAPSSLARPPLGSARWPDEAKYGTSSFQCTRISCSEKCSLRRSATQSCWLPPKFDDATLRALGEVGENAVASACRAFLRDSGRSDLANKVRRVSLISDALGYDVVSPDLMGCEHRLEVKCYRGPGPNFYLTRNEFEVGSTLPRWHLVLCRSTLVPEVIGWTSLASFRDRMPQELDRSARWQVARVTLEESDLRPGLPIESAAGPSEPDAPGGDQAT